MGGHVLTVGEATALLRAADVGDPAEVTGARSATGVRTATLPRASAGSVFRRSG